MSWKITYKYFFSSLFNIYKTFNVTIWALIIKEWDIKSIIMEEFFFYDIIYLYIAYFIKYKYTNIIL
jgi:hypothetical protein